MTQEVTKKRKAKICCMIESDTLEDAIQNSLEVICKNIEFIHSPDHADLIIFCNVKDVEANFDTKKTYAYLNIDPAKPVPGVAYSNVVHVNSGSIVTVLPQVINDINLDLLEIDEEEIHEETHEDDDVAILPDAKRILVIDDSPNHLRSAETTLSGQNLMTTRSYESAMNILGQHAFDVVLTDLYLPMSSKTLSPDAFKLGELVPYGFLLMLEAARQGVPHIAIVTDLNHHKDALSAGFDHFAGQTTLVELAKVQLQHATLTKDGDKDWGKALNKLLE